MVTSYPHISLEQWRVLLAVIDAGGYAQAASTLHKSQSAITYAVQKIEALLKVKVFEIHGRKAVLTAAGEVLQRRARTLLEEALLLERSASAMSEDWRPEIGLAVDTVFPTWLLLRALGDFARDRPQTRIELYETVLGGTAEALLDGRAQLGIAGAIPHGFYGDHLLRARFIAVAAPTHALHRLGRELTYRDLRRHRQLVLRDSGSQRKQSGGWLGAEQRWTVSHKATSLRALTMGLGFAWFPEQNILEELRTGALKPLPLKSGGERFADMYLILAQRDYADRDTQRLAELIRTYAEKNPAAD
jgi:DNA-binding transcriptional LysR family regulator